MLSPYRILDLTDGPVLLAGLALAQLGAEVVAVEPEGGHRTRFEGLYSAEADPLEGSLWHDAYGRGRVALTGGPELIARLAATADVVLEQWQRLARLLGAGQLADLSRTERQERQEELELLINEWTTGIDGAQIEQLLQNNGICGHRVLQSDGVLDDPQLRHRQFAREVPHPHHGTVWVEGSQARWSRTQPGPAHGGPPVGEHTQSVLQDLLGYSDERIAELVVAGSIS